MSLTAFQLFSSGAYELGLIVEAILASIIASYVFYLLVVLLKSQSDKAAIQPYIAKHTTRVVGDCQNQLLEISRVTGIDISLANASIESVTEAFRKIAPYSDAPLIISPPSVHANWFQYFWHHRNRSRQGISRLFAQLPYVDADLVSLLAAVDDCSHFYQIEVLQSITVKKDLSAFASTFYDYCELCRKLNEYRENHALGPIPD